MFVPLHDRTGAAVAFARVDDADFEALSAHCWHRWHPPSGRRGGPYARRRVGDSDVIFMHRQLLGLEAGDPREADHINGNGLDNRRSNLRTCTQAQNKQNVRGCRGTSRYRGVYWDPRGRKWRAQVKVDKRLHRLGSFDDEDEAGRVAAEFRAQHMPFSAEALAA